MGLVITRKKNESITIKTKEEKIKVSLSQICWGSVKLSIDAPKDVRVIRTDDQKVSENVETKEVVLTKKDVTNIWRGLSNLKEALKLRRDPAWHEIADIESRFSNLRWDKEAWKI
jgi:carbon storage regulator CsrA